MFTLAHLFVKIKLVKHLLLLFILFVSHTVWAEKLGTFSIDDIVLNSSFEYTDPKNGQFSLDGSLFSVKWENQKNLSVILSMGPQSLLNTSLFFEAEEKDFGLLEASANYYGVYGKVSMGLLPIAFSYEGQLKESERFFYRGLVFRKRLIPLRDFGFTYSTGHGHYKTSFTVHNGESTASNPDGRVFYTGNWAWETNSFKAGLSAMTGQVKSESLNQDISESLNLFNLNSTVKVRSGSLYALGRSKYFNVLGEAFLGQTEQDEVIKKWHAWHIDIIYKAESMFDVVLRADYIDPNRSFGGDVVREYTLGVSLRDSNRNNRLFLYATKVVDEGEKDKANDRFSLVWRVQPKILDLF